MMAPYLTRLAGRYSWTIDNYVRGRLKSEAPLAYWILSKKVLQRPIVAKLLRFRIEQQRSDAPYMSNDIRVFVFGRKIGTCRMAMSGELV